MSNAQAMHAKGCVVFRCSRERDAAQPNGDSVPNGRPSPGPSLWGFWFWFRLRVGRVLDAIPGLTEPARVSTTTTAEGRLDSTYLPKQANGSVCGTGLPQTVNKRCLEGP